MGESVWTIRAKKELSDDEVAALAGTLLTEEAFHTACANTGKSRTAGRT